jgi:hypothetical protein
MINKKIHLFIVLTLFSLNLIQAQVDIRKELFEPILENERLAYKMIGEKQATLQLFAQDINDSEKVRFIGEWGPVSEGSLQFTNNRKGCFFVIQRPMPYFFQGSLYKFSGNTGEVKYILDITYPFRVSRDGKFVVFSLLSMYDIYNDVAVWQGRLIIALWSTESNELLKIFDWKVKRNDVYGVGFVFAGDIKDNIINVYHVVEGGGVYAQAIINLETYEFEVLWDITDVGGISDKLKTTDDIFQYDDVVNKSNRLSPGSAGGL